MRLDYKGISHQARDLRWLEEFHAGATVQDIADKWHYSKQHVSIVLRYYGVELCYHQPNQLLSIGAK